MIFFHRFLIATAILFSIGYAGWSFTQFQGGGGTIPLVLAVVFALIAVGLVVYLKNLKRFLHR